MQNNKLDALRSELKKLGALAVAFSGGADSSFLLAAAVSALGDKAIAITADAPMTPRSELESAANFCKKRGIPMKIVSVDPFAIEGFASNPPDRCYHCKKALLTAMKKAAGNLPLAEGSNADDALDYRPGLRAVAELNVLSPLSSFTKDEIRALSREMGLETWDKPAMACLASRFPYGQPITARGLKRVEKAEETVHAFGVSELRVRDHVTVARIETDERGRAAVLANAAAIDEKLRELGYSYVALDLGGYRKGALNVEINTVKT